MWQDDPRETASRMKVCGPIMRISKVLIMVVACAFFPQHPGGVHATPPIRAFTVIVSTSCEAMVPAYCQGRFGFRATADGAFLVGPEPNGRSVSGVLRGAERRALQSAAAQVLAGIKASSVECHVRPEIPGVKESVEISAHDRTVVLRGSGGQLGRGCKPGDAMADAKMFTFADQLMRRYYPNPF
jgi:hypothetical protein